MACAEMGELWEGSEGARWCGGEGGSPSDWFFAGNVQERGSTSGEWIALVTDSLLLESGEDSTGKDSRIRMSSESSLRHGWGVPVELQRLDLGGLKGPCWSWNRLEQ